jgi:hypothetical protein
VAKALFGDLPDGDLNGVFAEQGALPRDPDSRHQQVLEALIVHFSGVKTIMYRHGAYVGKLTLRST